jgi:hypothetical protein
MTENDSWTTSTTDTGSDSTLAADCCTDTTTGAEDVVITFDDTSLGYDQTGDVEQTGNVEQTGYDQSGYVDPTTGYVDDQSAPVDDGVVVPVDTGVPVDTAPVDYGWQVAPEVAEITEDSQYWFQQGTNFTCGPAAVTQILEDFTGQQFDNEYAVANDALSMGWLSDQGMPLGSLDDLLTRWGVPSHVEQGGTDPLTAFQTVDQYIAEGRSVVLFVDASEYWAGDTNRDAYHFVRILDVDFDRGVAVLSDSGTPDGQNLEVPLSTLNDAWTDGLENQAAPTYGMVVSDVTDPDGVGLGAGAAAGSTAIEQGQPFALLPITMTTTGFEQLRTSTR